MMVYIQQQSFDCVYAAAERSPVLEIQSLHDSGFVKISHSVKPTTFNTLYLAK